MLEQAFYQVKGVLLSERIPPWAEVDAYTRLEFVGSKADRPYGSFARGRPERVAEPGPPPGRERERIGTVVRRALPWGAALAAPVTASRGRHARRSLAGPRRRRCHRGRQPLRAHAIAVDRRCQRTEP